MEIPELDAIAREAQAADGGVALEPETYRAWTRQVIEAAERLGMHLVAQTDWERWAATYQDPEAAR